MIHSFVRIVIRLLHSAPENLLKMGPLESAKKIAAYKAVNDYVQANWLRKYMLSVCSYWRLYVNLGESSFRITLSSELVADPLWFMPSTDLVITIFYRICSKIFFIFYKYSKNFHSFSTVSKSLFFEKKRLSYIKVICFHKSV